MTEKSKPTAVFIRGGSDIRIGTIEAIGVQALDAADVERLSVGSATSVMPQAEPTAAEPSPPLLTTVEPWYRQYWLLIVAAVLTVPGGLLVAYLQHWFGWNK